MDAAPPIIDVDPVEAMLAELAGLDMTLARHVHACAMATTETEEVTDLARAYQRIARSLRQSLALLERMKREHAQAARELPPKPSGPPPPPRDEARIAERRQVLERAARRVAWSEYEGWDCEEDLVDLEMFLDIIRDVVLKQTRRDTFGLVEQDGAWATQPLDDHVAHICRLLELPEAAARAWRDLPDLPDNWREPPDG